MPPGKRHFNTPPPRLQTHHTLNGTDLIQISSPSQWLRFRLCHAPPDDLGTPRGPRPLQSCCSLHQSLSLVTCSLRRQGLHADTHRPTWTTSFIFQLRVSDSTSNCHSPCQRVTSPVGTLPAVAFTGSGTKPQTFWWGAGQGSTTLGSQTS